MTRRAPSNAASAKPAGFSESSATIREDPDGAIRLELPDAVLARLDPGVRYAVAVAGGRRKWPARVGWGGVRIEGVSFVSFEHASAIVLSRWPEPPPKKSKYTPVALRSKP